MVNGLLLLTELNILHQIESAYLLDALRQAGDVALELG
jgi:hypothetical protein